MTVRPDRQLAAGLDVDVRSLAADDRRVDEVGDAQGIVDRARVRSVSIGWSVS